MRPERTDWQIFEIAADSDTTVRQRYFRELKGHGPSHAASTAGRKLLTRWFWLTSWPTGIGEISRIPSWLSRSRWGARGSASWRHNAGMRSKKKRKRNTCLFVLLRNYYLMGTNNLAIEVVLSLFWRWLDEWKGARPERIWERVEILHVTINWGHLASFGRIFHRGYFLVAGERSRQRRWHYFI